MMQNDSRWWKSMTLAVVCGLTLGFASGCVPDNLLVNTFGDIVNGLIISGVNLGLAGTGTGLQI